MPVKGKKTQASREKPLFHPTFGSRPAQIVGRDQVLEKFQNGLSESIGSRNRCILMTGQGGMGKTALLLEMADIAKDHDMIPALVTAYEEMNTEIIETIQRNAASMLRRKNAKIQGFDVGAFVFYQT